MFEKTKITEKAKEQITTDEELTEDYVEGLCKTCTVHTCRHNILKTCAIKESVKQAFLAGLKAKTEQHKVSEQLPTEEKEYLLKFNDGT